MFIIDDSMLTKGLGLILCGSLVKGEIKLNQGVMFGPDKSGNFISMKVKGMHQNRVPITEASAGM
jgi:GTPase